ncbi:winged helix-turn-helix domain-containing protein [Streptomyces sp. NPDC006798]|uniref:GntR family transcriptional regulator n=1 Tax=Streptomyces sp. NPDC006798 TaxID=3155462 RepID=UPI0033E07A22
MDGAIPREATYRYRRVADKLRKEINKKTYGPNERLPTQYDLAKRYGVSRFTVLQALEMLRDEGLIVTRQGSGTFVKGGPGAEGESGLGAEGLDESDVFVSDRVSPVILEPYLAEAFEAPEVTLDVCSMTTESLATRVSDQKERIVAGRIRPPRSITARLLLPDTRSPHLAMPRPVDGGDDPRVRTRLRGILQSHVTLLRSSLYELLDRGFVEEVSVETRLVPFSLQIKLYILNRRLALQGFYPPTEGTVRVPPNYDTVTILDSYGTGASLFPFRDSAPEQSGIVQAAQKYFDATWQLMGKEPADEPYGDPAGVTGGAGGTSGSGAGPGGGGA